jgi:hypothetical protein
MITLGTETHAHARRRAIPVGESVFYKGEWMESGEDPGLSPTVFLAEQPPNYTLETHFHRQNQFQLVVDGSATLGREILAPVTVHYAGAYTGYGPLISGPQGVKYFTIRPVFDTGLIPASQAREKMIRGPKRHAQVTLGSPWSAIELAQLQHVQDRLAMPVERGLAVRHVRLPPGHSLDLQAIEGSTGLFAFVLAGTAEALGQRLGRWESLFATRDECPTLTAAEHGAEVVVLHVPPTEPEYLPLP